MGGDGVEVRKASIRIFFSYRLKQHKEVVYLDEKPLPPTPANVMYARRMAREIKDKIRKGEFRFSDYFPHSPRAKAEASDCPMLHAEMDRWLGLLEVKASTQRQYEGRINNYWKEKLPDMPIDQVRYSHILKALNAGTWTSGKSRNNELSMVRQFFEFCRLDKIINENPCEDIKRVSYQRPAPDPFSLDEVEIILADIAKHQPEQTWNMVETVFFSGLRTNEMIGLEWPEIDFRKREMEIDGGVVYDEETDSTKTSVARKVKLNSRAMEALKRQKAHTFLEGKNVFHDPKTGKPWAYQKVTDVRSFWSATLKRCGIRYRRPYNMRHTYATIGLMSGANPAFLAKQLGHSLKMFFEVYADWIDGADNDREMEKIEGKIREVNPNLTHKIGNAEG